MPPETLDDAVAELRDAREAARLAKERADKARDLVLQMMPPSATEALTAAGTVKITTTTRRSVDATKLEALWPDVYEQVVNESTITTVRLP